MLTVRARHVLCDLAIHLSESLIHSCGIVREGKKRAALGGYFYHPDGRKGKASPRPISTLLHTFLLAIIVTLCLGEVSSESSTRERLSMSTAIVWETGAKFSTLSLIS